MPCSSTSSDEAMGRPEEGDRRVSRVEVPVEVTGVEAGLMPWGREAGKVEEEAEVVVEDEDGDTGEELAGL